MKIHDTYNWGCGGGNGVGGITVVDTWLPVLLLESSALFCASPKMSAWIVKTQ